MVEFNRNQLCYNTIKGGIIFPLILMLSLSTTAQKESYNWMFGSRAGITFNTTTPSALTSSQMDVIAGCATISDSAGNLLFYTNGVEVWNKNNIRMPNGYGLKGDPVRSTQSAIIIPKPSSKDIYYIFTVDASFHDPGDPPAGLNYSIVDLTANNGLGDVIQKNTSLNPYAFEKITACIHKNNNDIWVVSRQFFNAKYVAYLVTSSGVSSVAVESPSLIYYALNEWVKGYLRFDPSGKMLIDVGAYDDNELSYFDYSTGIIQPIFKFFVPLQSYGTEFSPESKFLYITGLNSTINQILQYDLSNLDPVVFKNSYRIISNFEGGAIQGAPDGKLYVAREDTDWLGVINQPSLYDTSC